MWSSEAGCPAAPQMIQDRRGHLSDLSSHLYSAIICDITPSVLSTRDRKSQDTVLFVVIFIICRFRISKSTYSLKFVNSTLDLSQRSDGLLMLKSVTRGTFGVISRHEQGLILSH